MRELHAYVVGFDITPRIHPELGAWGTTPSLKKVDMPLQGRCVALKQDKRCVLWYGLDLIGDVVARTHWIRSQIATRIGIDSENIIWSTSQTHSSGAMPGSLLTGSSSCETTGRHQAFAQQELERFLSRAVEAGRMALAKAEPIRIDAGKGICDAMSYNTRFPMPMGKFSRDHAEGLQSGKYFDPVIGLVKFRNLQGRTLGAIFNFCCHPATMIDGHEVSPDWVGTAREIIESSLVGAPAMFVQGMCGDVNCWHLFGTSTQAKRNGEKLGHAAVNALHQLEPISPGSLNLIWQTIAIPCRAMYSRKELEGHLQARLEFINDLKDNPNLTWICGINLPEFMSVEKKSATLQHHIDYLRDGLRILKTGKPVRRNLELRLGVLSFGELAAVLSPGENFTQTGHEIRSASPFKHTLICGDTNGMFGYIGDDREIDRGGYETDSYWKMLIHDGFRLAPAKGTVPRIKKAYANMLNRVSVATEPVDVG